MSSLQRNIGDVDAVIVVEFKRKLRGLRFLLDFWAKNAMLDIGDFEKAFGNFLKAFPYCGRKMRMRREERRWRKNFILFFTVCWQLFCC